MFHSCFYEHAKEDFNYILKHYQFVDYAYILGNAKLSYEVDIGIDDYEL